MPGKFSIMPFNHPMGGTPRVVTKGITASQTFEMGEVVTVVDAGTVTEPPQDGTEVLLADFDSGKLIGISCYGPGSANINPKTGTTTWAVNSPIQFWAADSGTYWITKNFYAAGGATAIAPALTDIGESYQLTWGTGTFSTGGTARSEWGVEQTAGVTGTDVCCIVHDILDYNKTPIRNSGVTPAITGAAGTVADNFYVVFEIKATL